VNGPIERGLREALATEWGSVIERLGRASTDEALDRPTRCADWTVRDLARHVLWGVSMEAEALEHARASDPTPAVGVDPGVVTDGRAAALTLEGHLRRLLDALEVLEATEATEPARRPVVEVPLAAATLPLDHVRDVLLMEAGVHADDLRHASTGGSSLPVDVVAATARFLVPFLPVAAASAGEPPTRPTRVSLRGRRLQAAYTYDGSRWVADGAHEPVADVVEVTGEDGALVLLLLGRLPAGEGRITWYGPGDPSVLKRWFPGP
jgi:uncharacterized protein (TIGR03083 family)